MGQGRDPVLSLRRAGELRRGDTILPVQGTWSVDGQAGGNQVVAGGFVRRRDCGIDVLFVEVGT